jgi:hypothetical protein
MDENRQQRRDLQFFLQKTGRIRKGRAILFNQGISKYYFEIMQEIIIPYLNNPDEAIKKLEALSKEYHHTQANKGGLRKAGRKPENTQQ